MKIKKLWVSKYKNLEDVTLEFQSDLITLLVGKNGLGKSNLIEILALIFRDLDLLEKLEDFTSWANNKDHFEYDIHYECYDQEVYIELRVEKFTILTKPSKNEEIKLSEIPFNEFIKDRHDKYLPRYVIGYYSGENKRIRDIIRVHEQNQWTELKKGQQLKKEVKDSGLRRLFFTENYHSQLLLLTLLAFKDDEGFKNEIGSLLNNYLNIEYVENFEIIFNNPDWNFTSIEKINKGVDYLIANINAKEPIPNPFWNVKGKVDLLLTRFYNYQLGIGVEPIGYQKEKEEIFDKDFIKEFLYFNSINLSQFISELKDDYSHPITFFDALEASNILEIIYDIRFSVKVKDIEETIEFSQLSEGEQQLLTVLGLILVTGTEDCLFLLDEPDTHLNPEWQRDYAELLEKFNLNDTNSHIFVATHSPLIVQSSIDSEILLFKKDNEKLTVEESHIEYETWRIDHVLTSEYFGLPSARPKNERLDEFYALREKILNGENPKENLKQLKPYIEGHLFPTGETYNDLVALSKIREDK